MPENPVKDLTGTVKKHATRKLGPLPAWAWGVVLAGGIWVWRGWSNRTRGDSGESATNVPSSSPGGGSTVVPSLSGGGAPPPFEPGFGSPEGQQSSLFVSGPDFTIEGESQSVSGIIDQLLAQQREDTANGGGGTTSPTETTKAGTSADPSSGSTTKESSSTSGSTTTKTNPCDPANFPRYTVVSGDTMKRIASKLYGNQSMWVTHIRPYNSPRSGNWDLIYPGETFRYKPKSC